MHDAEARRGRHQVEIIDRDDACRLAAGSGLSQILNLAVGPAEEMTDGE